MISILFVDDEPNILSGLQRMLRPMRHEWEMSFANSGAEALSLLSQRKMDVIVSDMKMPYMDGAQLLQQVSQQYPHLVRIILSGYAEKELILRAVSVSHQYLAKPCDAELLKATVSRSFVLRNILGNEKLSQLVLRMTVVPSLPSCYQQLAAELQAAEPSIKKVSDIIQQDMGMTVKILQIVNSAFFGLQRNISSPREAVAFLGVSTLASLALGVGIFSQFRFDQLPYSIQLLMERLWSHSLKVAELAHTLALSEAPNSAVNAFTAGLLHDIGQAVLASNFPDEYASMLSDMTEKGLSLIEAESLTFGVPNAAVGAYLLGMWGLSYPVVEAVAYHDDPYTYPSNLFTPLTAIHVANGLANHSEDDILAAPEKYFDRAYLQRLRLWEKVPAWFASCLKKETLDAS